MEIFGISVTEWVGYAASLGVLVSFLMKDINVLRIVNSIGCAFFVAYGLMLGSIPVVVTNIAILLINTYYLLKKEK